MRRIELQGTRRGLENRGDRAGERAAHLLVRHLPAEPGFPEIGDQLGGGVDAEICGDQSLLQLFERLGIQPSPGQNTRDVVPEAAR